MSYKTPHVYVEEQSILPPSVAEVSTAIPAFIGYTERPLREERTVNNSAVHISRISSLLEYHRIFGGAPVTDFTVTVEQAVVKDVKPKKALTHYLYDGLRLYFANGGSDCFIVSVGSYEETITKTAIEKGIEALKKEDAPTLIVMTDGGALSSDDYAALCQKVLAHCADLKDRFAIFDAGRDELTQVSDFRGKLGVNHLKYGAAYFPYLTTNLGYY